MHGMVRGITTVQQQKSHSYCLFKSRTKENKKKVYSYIYTKQRHESQRLVEVYWNHNGGSSWFCVWMEGNGYLSSEIDKTFILNFLWTNSQTFCIRLVNWKAARVILVCLFAVWMEISVDLHCLLSKLQVDAGDILEQVWR